MGIYVHTLRVEDQESPMGLDRYNLRFSWQINIESNTARVERSQIWIASNRENLELGTPDIWDSGMHYTVNPYMEYSGPRLQSAARYWWKVATEDPSKAVIWSEPAYFDTGFFEASDWKAEWIWSSHEQLVNDYAYLRKEIGVELPVAYAKMFVSSHHTAQVFLNGSRIGGYGSPAPTNPHKRKYYVAYDVTQYMTVGSSCISAIAHYIGGSGQNYVNGYPGFRLQLEVVYQDGKRQSWGTDDTWESLIELPRSAGAPFQQNRRISAVDSYDASKLAKGWQLPGLDQSAVRKAVIQSNGQENWPMLWQELPEGEVDEIIIPREITPLQVDRGRQVFDTGRIVSGWPRIQLRGIPGTTLRIRYSEDLDDEGFVKHNVCNEHTDHYYDEYSMSGEGGIEIWAPDLSYKAFRYVEVSGYPVAIVPGEQLSILFVHTALSCEGSFHSSNDLLNEMFTAAIHTQKNNVLGQIVDCPHREQAQYLADSDLQAELLLYNFEARSPIEKVLSDFSDAQLADGRFPFVYPSNFEHPDFNIQIPEWDLHFCTLLWKLYWATGDTRLLGRYYDPAARMVEYYYSKADKLNGLIQVDQGWHISDWPYPTVEHSSRYLTVQNIKLIQATRIMADIARLIGRIDESEIYSNQAHNLSCSVVNHLYDTESMRFRDCLGSEAVHQGVNGLALYAGLVPQADQAAVIDYIADAEWVARTVLSLPMLRAMFENGKPEAAYKLLSREAYPGWGYMIKQGAKTMWEGWDDKESHSHAWNGYPIRLLQEYVVGIQAVSPGFADIQIRPFFPEGLRYMDSRVVTVKGQIHVRWEIESEQPPEANEGSTSILMALDIPYVSKVWLNLDMLPACSDLSVSHVDRPSEILPLEPKSTQVMLTPGRHDLCIRYKAVR